MLFTFSPFNLQHGVHPNMVSVAAHLPWMLVAIRAVLVGEGATPRIGAGALALLVGSAVLLGHPQALWMDALVAGLFVAFLLVTDARSRRAGALAWLGVGGLLGAGVGAGQLVASLHAVAHSTRPTDADYATSFSLPPIHLLQLLHPYLLWGRVLRWTELPGAGDEYGAYGGSVAIVLAVWWLARQARSLGGVESDRRRLGVAALVLVVLGLWLATGRYGGLYYAQTWLPVVGRFRIPSRDVFVAQFGLAVLGALAMGVLTRRDGGTVQRRADRLWPVWGLVAVSVTSALVLVFTGSAGAQATRASVVAGPLLLGCAALLLSCARRGWRWAAPLLVVLAVGDQALYGIGGVIAWRDYGTRTTVLGVFDPPEQRPVVAEGRLALGGSSDLYLLLDYRLLDGYLGLTPARQLDYSSPAALRVAQVAYANERFRETPIAGGGRFGTQWYRLAPPLPRVRLVTEAIVSHAPARDIESVDVSRTALVTHDLQLSGGSPGDTLLVQDAPGRLRVRTASVGRQLLVVSESWDDGWTATVDKHPVAVERVYGDFLGVAVEAGTHAVTLAFRPAYRDLQLRLGPVAALLALALVVTGWWRRAGGGGRAAFDEARRVHRHHERGCEDHHRGRASRTAHSKPPTPNAVDAFSTNSFHKSWKLACEQVKVSVFRPYLRRHSYATLLRSHRAELAGLWRVEPHAVPHAKLDGL